MNGKIVKGSVVLNRELTTQLGKVTAKDGTQLVSVFLGAVKNGEDPEPAKRMESLGWRQMSMFECAVRIITPTDGLEPEEREWRLAYSCLGAVDAVEAAIRFANKMVGDEFAEQDETADAPFISTITVGTIKLGPIGEDGTPFNGRGPAFFGWKYDRDVSLEAHLQELREKAQRAAL